MDIQRLGVIGAGQMGAGIAQVSAQAGLNTIVSDVSDDRLAVGRNAVESSLQRLVKKGRQTEDEMQQTLQHLKWTTHIEDHSDRQLVIEAVPENELLKRQILQDVEAHCADDAIVASNTSSISITRLGSALKRPDQFIGMHFMNPVPIMELVEVIKGAATSDETCKRTVELAGQLGKQTTVAEDYPGFIANRILMPMINEAFFALMEGIGTPEDIDRTMTLGARHPIGPLALADLIGLDTCLAIMEILHHELGDSKYRPCPLLRRYVAANWFGRKSNRGVFEYEG